MNNRGDITGGFIATLALIISIIALVMAYIALERTGGDKDLDFQLRDLKTRVEELKEETAKRVDDIREETADALERIGKAMKKD
jgi:hypothetical protein